MPRMRHVSGNWYFYFTSVTSTERATVYRLFHMRCLASPAGVVGCYAANRRGCLTAVLLARLHKQTRPLNLTKPEITNRHCQPLPVLHKNINDFARYQRR